MRALLIVLLAPAAVALAQDNPLSAFSQMGYRQVKTLVLRSAEKMPEENYGFKPTESVRSYGQILGHMADSLFAYCDLAQGAKNPAPRVEQTKTSKSDITAALKDAFANCDRAFDGLTDATALQTLNFHGVATPRVGILIASIMHVEEHYGNLVTYMRLKDILPPSSEPGAMPHGKK
ncbi:MAG: DinB family protein [Acidobacteriia bacterium]|nr:DinB family protein [Terriglobia bacterium]